MKLRHSLSIATVAGLTLLAASCGDDDDDSAADSVATVATIDESSTETTDSATETTAESMDTTAESTATTEDSADTTEAESTSTDSQDSGPSTSDENLEERADDIRDALSNGDFTTMLDLLELSGLSDELEGREITVLAPSESAFSDLTADELAELVTDRSGAEELLRRHIIDGLYTYDELAALTEVTTISDETLPVASEGDTVTVAGATVTPPDADELAGEEGQEVAVFGIDQLLLDEQ